MLAVIVVKVFHDCVLVCFRLRDLEGDVGVWWDVECGGAAWGDPEGVVVLEEDTLPAGELLLPISEVGQPLRLLQLERERQGATQVVWVKPKSVTPRITGVHSQSHNNHLMINSGTRISVVNSGDKLNPKS